MLWLVWLPIIDVEFVVVGRCLLLYVLCCLGVLVLILLFLWMSLSFMFAVVVYEVFVVDDVCCGFFVVDVVPVVCECLRSSC